MRTVILLALAGLVSACALLPPDPAPKWKAYRVCVASDHRPPCP